MLAGQRCRQLREKRGKGLIDTKAYRGVVVQTCLDLGLRIQGDRHSLLEADHLAVQPGKVAFGRAGRDGGG